jgi:trehalose-phosphatase
MNTFEPGIELTAFFHAVAAAARRALLLDYDGTLAPFRVERDQAVPYPGVRDALGAMIRAGHTRLVVISGRRASDVPALLGLERPPEIWGTHGWERLRADGAYQLDELGVPQARGLAEAAAWAEARLLGGHCERKPASVALHWRGLPPAAAAELRREAMGRWAPLAADAGLALHSFDGGIELRAPGRDKGFAVRTILEEIGEGAALAYLGDDLTDEDAFKALAGCGLGVLVRAEPRPTAATAWLRPPDELLAFLWRWHWTAVLS